MFRLRTICFWAMAAVLSAGAQSVRPGMGSTSYKDAGGTGMTFRVWAPNANAVGVKGQFNGWATTAMVREGATGLWSIDVPGARAGQEYKYVINNSFDRRDPRSRRVTHSNGNSVTYDPAEFDWGDEWFATPAIEDLVIYEMHVGTFNAEEWVPSGFDKAAERLDHLRMLGVSAVQVMPVNEFATDKSWGYNPSDVFAIESGLGGPDAFKRFVKACHEREMAVLVDVVHNHYGPSDLSTWQYDGWSQNGLGGIYHYNDITRAGTWWGNTRPDYGRPEVRQFVRDQIFMFLEEYRVDGFRWDSVFNIIYCDGGQMHLPDGEAMLRDINWEMQQDWPGKLRIAEDHAFDFSMNFDSQWDTGFRSHIEWQVTQADDSSRNMSWLAQHVAHPAGRRRVISSETHDSVGDLNNKVRLPRAIDGNNPWSIWARKRQLLAASMVMTSPGIPQIFQGQEMNEDWTFSSGVSLRWSLTNTWSGIVRAYSDLIHLRRNRHGGTQGLKGEGVTVHHVDDLNKALAFVRWDAGGRQDDVVVVANFASGSWTNNNYFIEFPSPGNWYCHFNGDNQEYCEDFGGIGGDMVVAEGTPPRAAVNMGSYSLQIFSTSSPPTTGAVIFDPPAPSGCVELVVTYEEISGPLAGAERIMLSVGRNGWQDPSDAAMTNLAPGVWQVVVTIPDETVTLDMAFHDGAESNRVWDNNLGRDWHLPVEDCADLPSLVVVSPSTPHGCLPVVITYHERSGPLKNAERVGLHIGRNDWRDVRTLEMTEISPGVWQTVCELLEDTWQLDFVFHNNADGEERIWDNNSGRDWIVYVTGCAESSVTGIAITNPPHDIVVSNAAASISIEGKCSPDIIGMLGWTNALTGHSGSVPASPEWSVGGLELAEGVNLIRIAGTNSGVNPNACSLDIPTNAVYVDSGSWIEGQDGGSGWGDGWTLRATGNSGHFLATQELNLDSAVVAWGMWANGGGLAEAVRPFAGRLNVGDLVRVRFENNGIDTDSSVGLAFQNRWGQSLFEFLFVGGGTNYLINDEEVARMTGLAWTDQGIDLSFELSSSTAYSLDVGGRRFDGSLASTSEAIIDRIRFWNNSAGGGSERNLYITELSVTGGVLEAAAHHAEVAVTRPYGPLSDQDGDGHCNWEEELAGTDPNDASSHPPRAVVSGGSVAVFEIADTVLGRWYDIYSSTNLLTGLWIRQHREVRGSGGAVTITVTNTAGNVFYRTGVLPEP